ncbi:MAG: hypothetical protein CMH32_05090 [Micavibrio sp.]|nr:hypothetical protein [Micavibrio sp.]HCK32657.1 hypothetical protein [Rhodospirillaceae bacterium]
MFNFTRIPAAFLALISLATIATQNAQAQERTEPSLRTLDQIAVNDFRVGTTGALGNAMELPSLAEREFEARSWDQDGFSFALKPTREFRESSPNPCKDRNSLWQNVGCDLIDHGELRYNGQWNGRDYRVTISEFETDPYQNMRVFQGVPRENLGMNIERSRGVRIEISMRLGG